MIHPETHPRFAEFFPRSGDLGLKPIDAGPGFDELELEKALGSTRFEALMKGVKSVFVCAHARYIPDHPGAVTPKRDKDGNLQAAKTHRLVGYEVHCVYAKDLEAFLASEAK